MSHDMQVNSGKLDFLLDRLVKISYFGLEFLNCFLMSFPLYTDSHTVFDFIEKKYQESLSSREKRRGSISPMDAVRDARGEATPRPHPSTWWIIVYPPLQSSSPRASLVP